MNVEKQFLAVEIGEKLLETIRLTNDDKRLMLKYKQFMGANYENQMGVMNNNPEQQGMLHLLNQKLAQDPNFPIPHGYKKVQELIIEESHQVPEKLGMKESEKVSMEVLDEILMKAFGVHILQPVPVKRMVTSVVPDQKTMLLDYAAGMNIRSQSQGSSVFQNDI